MACTSNNTAKPDVVSRPSNIYGAPQGQTGRTFGSVDYGIQGIVLHCTDMTISQYVQYLACLTQPVVGANQETNHHYSIGSAGALNQHIADSNISWTFGNYSATAYATPPSSTISVDWPALQAVNGTNVSPDVYVINIMIAKSYNQGTSCVTSSGLPKDQHDKLIQLLSYLSATYNIALDADHINWHDNIATQACPSNECSCNDIACLLTDINTYCEEDCGTITYSELNCDEVSHLLAIPNSCGNSNACLVSVPFDACCFGHLPVAGDIEVFVGLASQASVGPCDTDADLCLVKNYIGVTAPITGKGTASDPLALDLCLFGDFIPDGVITSVAGLDTNGCLVEQIVGDVVVGAETPITPIDTNSIDLTVSETSDHTLQADLKVSTQTGNLIQVDANGVYVGFDCSNLKELFSAGILTNIHGVDTNGNCVTQDLGDAVEAILCDLTVSDGSSAPMHVLGRSADMSCPLVFTPLQLVNAGFTIQDTNSVDLGFSASNVLTADVIVDPATDNILQITTNGLYVPEVDVTALDSCINATITDNEISIGLNIDPVTNNILTCGANGLLVPDLVPTDTDCVEFTYDEVSRELEANLIFAGDQNNVTNVISCITEQGLYVPRGASPIVNGPLIGLGTGDNPLDIDFSLMDAQDICDLGNVIPDGLGTTIVDVIGRDGNGCLRRITGEEFINNFLDTTNTDCVDITLTGNTLSINPVISPAIGGFINVLTCTSTGLYVPLGAGVTPQPTNCIDIQLTNGVLTATPILDPDVTNQLSCNVDGLYIGAGAGVTGGTTDCIQVVAANGVVTATPIISGAILGVANVLSCEAGGLFVPAGAGLIGVDSDCLTVDFDTATGELTIEPIISPLTDNILECTVNGLYVQGVADFISSVTNTDCIELDIVGGELRATPIIDPDTDNLVECTASGLFANFSILDTACINLSLNAGVLSAEPIIDPATSNMLTCGIDGLIVEMDANVFVDSDCINFDVVNGLVTATPILAPDQGALTNVLQCIGSGLYVPVAAGLTTLDGSCVDLTLVNGVLTAEIIIDNVTADNAITCGPDGLYVPECCPIVVDTTTVNLTLNSPRTISAEVIIDPDADNALVANANGLFVPQDFIRNINDTQCIALDVTGGVLTSTPIIDPDAGNQLTCGVNGLYVPPLIAVDSNCIDIDITGGTITANPIISATVDNQFQCLADGMFIPKGAGLEVLDTNCIDLEIANGVISAQPIISTQFGDNQITCESDGLYTPAPFITSVLDTNCLDLTVTDGVLSIEPNINPTADNQIFCTPTGLYVAPMTVVDTDCIDLDVTGGTLTATIIVNPAVDNTLTCEAGTGLYVLALTVIDSNCIDLSITNNVLTANPIISVIANNQITCQNDGLFVPRGAGLAVTDTDCIDLEIVDGVISAQPILSTQFGDNQITCESDGLYVPQPFITDVLDTQCLNLTVTNGVLSIEPIVSPLADNLLVCQGDGLYVPPLNVVDTNCIDVDITNGTLTINPILSSTSDNALDCLGDGLYVPRGANATGLDTDCMTVTVTDGIISVDPIIDPDLDNQLQCLPTGLFVATPFVTGVSDTQCIELAVTNGVLTATPVIDPAADNGLDCGVSGLYVQPITVVDTNCIDLDLTNNVLTANPIISATAGNQLDCVADGFYVPRGAGLSVLDTDCIDLEITDGVISAAPIISTQFGDNQLTCETDGLYVPAPFITNILDTQCLNLTVTNGVLSIEPIVSPLADNLLVCQGDGLYVPPITVVDTDCIDFTFDGATLTAEIVVDPAADNILTCQGTGLYVPELQVVDTTCIDLTINNNVLSADIIASPLADNLLVCQGDGLYVAQMTVIDTNCIDLEIVNNVLTASPIVSATPDNQFQCLVDGMYVPQGAGLQTLDTDCLDLDVINGVISGSPILAPTQGGVGNALTCIAGQGLYVPQGLGITVLDTNCMNLVLTGGNIIQAYPIIAPDLNGINNNLICTVDGLYAPETVFTRNEGASLAGGNTIDVDLDGDGITEFTFCEGFCEIVSANDCDTGGVGDDYYVRQFEIADDVLTINSAPMHDNRAGGVNFSNAIAVDGAIGVSVDELTQGINFASDPCYDTYVSLTLSINIFGTAPAGSDFSLATFYAQDGFDIPASAATIRINNLNGANPLDFAQEATTAITFIIGAGAAPMNIAARVISVLHAGGPVNLSMLTRMYFTTFTTPP